MEQGTLGSREDTKSRTNLANYGKLKNNKSEVKMATSVHIPVMVTEVIEVLGVRPWARYIDCTLGAGGHAAAILEHSFPGGQLLGIDTDPEAIKVAQARLN